MLCSRARTALSTRLDEEPLPPGVTPGRLAGHLAECPACRRWEARAEELQRAVRDAGAGSADTGSVEDPTASFIRPEGRPGPPPGNTGRDVG